MNSDEGYILKSINRHRHFGSYLHPASKNILFKGIQKDLKIDSDKQLLSSYLFRVSATLDLLERGEPLEKIMLRGGGRKI
jgi:hypothetical protein